MPDFMVTMENQKPNYVGVKTCHCAHQHTTQAYRKRDELLTAQHADWKTACSTGRLYPTGRPSSFSRRRSGLQKSSGCGTKSEIVPVLGMRAYSWSRGIAPPILNLGTRWRWVVTVMHRSLYSRDRIAIFLNSIMGGGGGGGGVLDVAKKEIGAIATTIGRSTAQPFVIENRNNG